MWLGWWTDWQDLPSGQKLLWNCNSSMRIDGERCWFSSCRVGLLCARAGWEQGWETELETNPVFLFFAFFFPREQDHSVEGVCWKVFRPMSGIIEFSYFSFLYFGCFKWTGPGFCPSQPWQCRLPWLSSDSHFGVMPVSFGGFEPPQTSGGQGNPFQTSKEQGSWTPITNFLHPLCLCAQPCKLEVENFLSPICSF